MIFPSRYCVNTLYYGIQKAPGGGGTVEENDRGQTYQGSKQTTLRNSQVCAGSVDLGEAGKDALASVEYVCKIVDQ